MLDLLSHELLSRVLEQLPPQWRCMARQACKRLDAASRALVKSVVLTSATTGVPDWSRFPALTDVTITGYDSRTQQQPFSKAA